jgi:hypothetical protein
MSFDLEGKRLIFTVCTGRCGTELLAQRQGQLPGVTALHEPKPAFQSVMRDTQQDHRFAIDFWEREKLPAIAQTPHAIYAETTHVFCKGFLEPLLNLGLTPDLVMLARSHREVALSLFRLNCVPARTEAGLAFLLSPDDPGVLPIIDWEELHDYQLCYWYCLEIERRQQEYAELITAFGGKSYKTTLAEIRTGAGIKQLIADLKLPRPGFLQSLKWSLLPAGKVNRKSRHKRSLDSDLSIEQLEQDVRDRLCPDEKHRKRAA